MNIFVDLGPIFGCFLTETWDPLGGQGTTRSQKGHSSVVDLECALSNFALECLMWLPCSKYHVFGKVRCSSLGLFQGHLDTILQHFAMFLLTPVFKFKGAGG